MMKRLFSLIFLTAFLISSPVHAATLDVNVVDIAHESPIPPEFAFCQTDGEGKTKEADNKNPEIEWSAGPEGTKSYVLLVVDKDVPASFELANQEGKIIPKAFARQDFYHWVLTDIPSHVTFLKKGQDSYSVTAGGKPVGKMVYGTRGQNDYATFMKGTYGGYDGPCPPWNDERVHHYHFQVFALDVPTLNLSGEFNGRDVLEAMDGHVLAHGEVMATYTNRK